MGPYAQIQSDVKARLQTSVILAPIAMELEEMGDINARIEKRLIQKGVAAGSADKLGMALLILTPKGRAADPIQTEAQVTTVRVSLFCNPTINKSPQGYQLAPLDVYAEIVRMMISWYRQPGQRVKMKTWDSMENNRGEISYFSDYEVPHVINLASGSGETPAPVETAQGTVWPFRDAVTGQIVYLRVADGQLTVSPI